jgi:hypothetical protein
LYRAASSPGDFEGTSVRNEAFWLCVDEKALMKRIVVQVRDL